MTTINKSNSHVRGLMIINDQKTIEVTVIPNDCDATKLTRKLLMGPIMVTTMASTVQLIIT
ncbi:MAG: hypothetical protein ABFC57_16545 [Veillonellales bacterium]